MVWDAGMSDPVPPLAAGWTVTRTPMTSFSRRSRSAFTAAPFAGKSSTSTIIICHLVALLFTSTRSTTQKNLRPLSGVLGHRDADEPLGD